MPGDTGVSFKAAVLHAAAEQRHPVGQRLGNPDAALFRAIRERGLFPGGEESRVTIDGRVYAVQLAVQVVGAMVAEEGDWGETYLIEVVDP